MPDVEAKVSSTQSPTLGRGARLEELEELLNSGEDGSLSLDVTRVAVERLLQRLLLEKRSGRLSLVMGTAEIAFSGGRVQRSAIAHCWGLEALVRSIALTRARYELILEPVEEDPEFHCGLRELEQVVFPRLARFGLTRERAIPLDAHLQVDFSRLATLLPGVPDEVNGVMRLFDGHRSVREVVLESCVDEVLTLEVATRLYLMGVVVPVQVEFVSERPLRKAPPSWVVPLPPRKSKPPYARGPRPAGDEDVEDWSTESISEAAAHLGQPLSPELSRQLEAFNVGLVVESTLPSAEQRRLRAFADSGLDDVAVEASLESVAQERLGRRWEARSVPPRTVTPVLVPQVLPEAQVPSRRTLGDPRRTVTPLLMPAVAARTHSAAMESLEADFFSVEPAPHPPVKDGSRLSKWAILAVAAVLVLLAGLGLELFRSPVRPQGSVTQKAVGGALPSLAPDSVRGPAKGAVAGASPESSSLAKPVATAPHVELPTLASSEAIDVSESLDDARRAYEGGEYGKAARILEQVTLDAPASAQAWLLLALARYDRRELPGARAALDKAQMLDPRSPRAHILEATMRQEGGDKVGAKASLQQALAVDPQGPFATEARALLNRW
jgi:hypothetical protein